MYISLLLFKFTSDGARIWTCDWGCGKNQASRWRRRPGLRDMPKDKEKVQWIVSLFTLLIDFKKEILVGIRDHGSEFQLPLLLRRNSERSAWS
mmetsp:Transcript_80379/g.215533  ORF Transcript_80379/g.215533 Transcript_80379/m.215533 type:complete len:93 (-) Transcript_80379:601-879(-)